MGPQTDSVFIIGAVVVMRENIKRGLGTSRIF